MFVSMALGGNMNFSPHRGQIAALVQRQSPTLPARAWGKARRRSGLLVRADGLRVPIKTWAFQPTPGPTQ